MHELAVFKLCVLREDGDVYSVAVLEAFAASVRSLNHAGMAFEVLALPRSALAVYQKEFEAGGVTSLPALVDTRSGQCVAQGAPGIKRWIQSSLKSEPSPDENYHDWVADKVGTADSVARERASGRKDEDEDKFSGGFSDSQMSKAFDDFARERERVGLPDPRKARRDPERDRPLDSLGDAPRSVPPRSGRTKVQEDHDEISEAIAASGAGSKEQAMQAAMFANMTS